MDLFAYFQSSPEVTTCRVQVNAWGAAASAQQSRELAWGLEIEFAGNHM
jgi:hypothetical protein